MQRNHMSCMNDEASGIVVDAFKGIDVSFNAITILHESNRHVVFKAKRFGRWWIVKGLTPATDTEVNRALLRKEFDIMMMLPSEGFAHAVTIENVPDFGMCIIMEYVEGLNLSEWLQTFPSPENRRRVALMLVDSLQQLHRTGIVSRDIKPANIIISRLSQMPVIIDFDLADTDTHTAFKSPGGTANYISPEQAVGFVPDCRNDIYSLAKVLEQMRLPRVWKPVLKRCLCKLDRRIPNAATLRRELLKAERRKRIAIWCAIGAAAIAAVIFGYRQLSQTFTLPAGLIAAREVPAIVIHDTIVATGQNVDSLNRRISLLTDSINSIQTERLEHQRALEADTKAACREIQSFWKRTAMHDLEVSPAESQILLGTHLQELNTFLDSLRKRLRTKYTDAEMAGIEIAFSTTVTECYNKWNQKQKEVTSSASE